MKGKVDNIYRSQIQRFNLWEGGGGEQEGAMRINNFVKVEQTETMILTPGCAVKTQRDQALAQHLTSGPDFITC